MYIWNVSLSKGIGIIFVLRWFFIGWNYCLCEQSSCANERIFLQIKGVKNNYFEHTRAQEVDSKYKTRQSKILKTKTESIC